MTDGGPGLVPEPGYDELRSRISIARSVLGHAPLYRAVRMGLAALDGATLEELAARENVAQEPPHGEPAEYLRGWHDGWDARDAAETERRGDGTAA